MELEKSSSPEIKNKKRTYETRYSNQKLLDVIAIYRRLFIRIEGSLRVVEKLLKKKCKGFSEKQ